MFSVTNPFYVASWLQMLMWLIFKIWCVEAEGGFYHYIWYYFNHGTEMTEV